MICFNLSAERLLVSVAVYAKTELDSLPAHEIGRGWITMDLITRHQEGSSGHRGRRGSSHARHSPGSGQGQGGHRGPPSYV